MKNLTKWEPIIEQHELSGLSASEYCRVNSLSVSAFYKARTLIRKRCGNSSGTSLVPLAIVPSKEEKTSVMIRVCFQMCEIQIPASLPLAVIKELLSISRESLCS